jgi:hypothetical protein
LPAPSADDPPPYVDVDGDGVASIADLLQEVQELRSRNPGASGESPEAEGELLILSEMEEKDRC